MPDLSTQRAAVEACLREFIAQRPLPGNLRRAIEYATLGGGKRLRPIMAMLCCEAAGGRGEDAVGPGSAIELIHCFSLVHDDLPAMDDDDLRRGMPTVHIEFGEAMAILAGDAMMSLAFELAHDSVHGRPAAAAVMREVAAATTDMIAGQVYDTLGGLPEEADPREQLELIHRNKTGALIRAACTIGALCAEAEPTVVRQIHTFGELAGLMFQVVDDLLDVTQSAEATGKATNKDIDAGKRTFPGLFGVEGTRTEVARLHRAAIDALTPLGEKANPLKSLCDYMAVRTS